MRHFAHKQVRRPAPGPASFAGSRGAASGPTQRADEGNAALLGAASPPVEYDFDRIPLYPPATSAIQTKLTVGEPDDDAEREAERLAERVMRMPEPWRQRARPSSGGFPDDQAERPAQAPDRALPMHVGSGAGDQEHTVAPPIVAEVVSSPGRPLDPATRTLMEPRFGHDFSRVQVHTDERAAESARAIQARAYTAGNDVVFGTGRYAPRTSEGDRLLAHELAHVVQQTGAIQRQPETKAAEKATVNELELGMGRQIDLWKAACQTGVGEFVHAELASQIDALSQGSWETFFITLAGNTVWAAAAFVPAGRIAFAVSMVGIGIAAKPTVPNKGGSKDELTKIEDGLNTYIEQIHTKLNGQLPERAAALAKEHPGLSLDEGVRLFLDASFKPDMVRHDQPKIDDTAVRRTMRESAAYMLALHREITKVEYPGEHTSVAWLSPPDYGDKKLAVVFSSTGFSNGVVKFVRWVPKEEEELALATQRSQPVGVQWYFFEQQVSSSEPMYLMWLVQHGWKPEDGFGLEWAVRKEKRAKATR